MAPSTTTESPNKSIVAPSEAVSLETWACRYSYPVMLLSDGSSQVSAAWPSPAAAVSPVGLAGGPTVTVTVPVSVPVPSNTV